MWNQKSYMKKYMPKYYQINKDKWRNYNLKHDFKIDLETYNQLFIEQKGLCAICYRHQSQFKQSFAVDHCHITNKIRGLLCMNCNVAIGSLNDNIITFQRAIDYLNRR